MKYILLVLSYAYLASLIAEESPPKKAFGVYNWVSWRPHKVNKKNSSQLRGVSLIMHWNGLEPKGGDFKFD